MGFFDFLKNDKEEKLDYDVTNLKITNLKKGFLLDYDLKTWQVKNVYEYDWGGNSFSYEYQLESEDDTIYLHVENDDELELTVSKKIRLATIDENVTEHIIQYGSPQERLNFKGLVFQKEEECPGFFRNMEEKRENSAEFISWDYEDKNGDYNINIEQWGEREFDASFGKVVKEFEFSNIIPNSK